MDAMLVSLVLFVLLIIFLGSGVWIFSALLLVSIVSLYFVLDYPLVKICTIMVQRVHASAGMWELSCIPIFMWMGEIIVHTDISERLFRGLAPLVNKFPGKLLHTNVFGCAMFAAVSGSSAATTLTIGRITLPELSNRKYDTRLSLGSLAGAGSFGFMIPPSIILIVYGVLSSQSIAQLFLAGVLPGLLMASLYSTYLGIRCLINPNLAPDIGNKYSIKDYFKCIGLLVPIILLIVIVLGSIYTGLATPTEAASVGVFASLIISVVLGQFTWKIFWDSLMKALTTSCMVCSLLAAAAFLSTAMGYLHIPQDISKVISELGLSPYALLAVLGIFYTVLGFFLDGTSITVMSLPICLPLVVQAGFDPVWFGIFLVVMVELAMITPPVGFNLFVIQGMSGHSIGEVAIASVPFFFLLIIGIIIITIFPHRPSCL